MSYEQTDIAARTDFASNLRARRSKERATFEDAIAREEQERQRKEHEATMAPIFAAQAEQNKIRAAIREAEKQEVLAGRRDPGFIFPGHMKNVRMSFEDAKEFNCQQAARLRDTCEEFRPFNTPENCKLICDYLLNQGVAIADVDCYRQAFLRLRELELFLNKRAPEPQPAAEPELQPTVEVQELDPVEAERIAKEKYHTEIVAFYAGKSFTQFDLDRLPADEYRKVMGLYGENLPRFSNVIQQ